MASMEVAERVAGTPQGSAAAGGATPALTRAEVAKHCTVDNCWVIIDYSVYDLTRFMDFHPGGSRAISLYAGKDITEVFYSLHKSSVLHKYGPKFFIGRLADAPPAPNALAEVGGPESELSNPGALSTVPYGEVPHLREGWHSPYYNDSHRSYRQNLREFLISELHDLTMSSDAANVLPPLDVLKKPGRMGLWAAKLGPGPHMKGMTIMGVRGKDFDLFHESITHEEFARMVSKLEAHQAWLESLTYQMMMMNHMEAFMKLAGPIALLKMYSSRIAYELSDDAVQIFGGRAITLTGMGEHVERFQRAIKFGSILGGSEEIMADLAIRMASRYITPDARL